MTVYLCVFMCNVSECDMCISVCVSVWGCACVSLCVCVYECVCNGDRTLTLLPTPSSLPFWRPL